MYVAIGATGVLVTVLTLGGAAWWQERQEAKKWKTVFSVPTVLSVEEMLSPGRFMLKLDSRLAAALQGEARPANLSEQLGFACLCLIKKRYAESARFYADAFAGQPELADDLQEGHRYNAARAVSLAAGQSKDAAKLDDKVRARLRQQALGWLRADLAL
jgi:hypothetical protein